MSTESQNQNVHERELTKTVQIVGYLDFVNRAGIREIANKVYPETDWYAVDEWEKSTHSVVGSDSEVEIDEETYDILKGNIVGDVELKKEVEAKQSHKRRESSLANKMFKEMAEDMPDEILGRGKLKKSWKKYKGSDGDSLVRFFSYADKMPLLKKPNEIEPDDMYVDEEERPAVKYKIRVANVTKEEMEEVQVMVIDHFVDILMKQPIVEEVRWTDCEREEVTKGSCINI